jgi:CheY-like chemotaxis protein
LRGRPAEPPGRRPKGVEPARVEDRTRALYAGFSSHVLKPVEPMELFAVIASLVSGRWHKE